MAERSGSRAGSPYHVNITAHSRSPSIVAQIHTAKEQEHLSTNLKHETNIIVIVSVDQRPQHSVTSMGVVLVNVDCAAKVVGDPCIELILDPKIGYAKICWPSV